jgi:hypothetical protein
MKLVLFEFILQLFVCLSDGGELFSQLVIIDLVLYHLLQQFVVAFIVLFLHQTFILSLRLGLFSLFLEFFEQFAFDFLVGFSQQLDFFFKQADISLESVVLFL